MSEGLDNLPSTSLIDSDGLGDIRYDLDQTEISELSAKLLAEFPPKYVTDYVCYRFPGVSEYSNLGRTLEQRIFNEAFPSHPHTPEEMHKEYGMYENSSIFLVSFDTNTQEPVGVVRIIYNSDNGLKSVNDLADLSSDSAHEWAFNVDDFMSEYGISSLDDLQDIGTLGVLRDYRSSAMTISAQLYRGLYVTIMDKQIGTTHGISIIDVKTLGQLRKHMGLPMHRIMGTQPFEYLGSNAEATYSRPDEYEKAVRRKIIGMRMAKFILKSIPNKKTKKHAKDADTLINILTHFIDGNDGTPVKDGSLQFNTDIRR